MNVRKIEEPATLMEIVRWAGVRKAEFMFDLTKGEGYWVPGIAAAFLFECAGVVFIEGVVTNPNKSLLARHGALEVLTPVMIEKAKEKRPEAILAFTTNETLVHFGVKNGLVEFKEPMRVVGWLPK